MIERRQRKFKIVRVETGTLLRRAGRGTCSEPYVPHRLDHGTSCRSGSFFRVVVREGKENVNVRKGKEVFPSVAAQGEQRGLGRSVGAKGATPKFDQQAIHNRRPAPDRCSAVARAVVGLAHERHLLRVLLSQIVDDEGGSVQERLRQIAFGSKLIETAAQESRARL